MRPWFSTPFVEVSAYGLFSVLGVIIAGVVFFSLNRNKAYELPGRALAIFAVFVLTGGFLGARLFFLLVSFSLLGTDPLAGSVILTSAGSVFFGGLLAGLGAGFLASRLYGLPFARLVDLAVTSLPLGHALGRVGCFLAGCCYGVATETVFGIVFPAHHPSHPESVLPVQLFEAVFNLALIFFLLAWFRKGRHAGTYRLPALYLVFYATFRFLIEFFRADAIRGVNFLSTSQWISLPLFLAGLYLFFSHPHRREDHHAKG